ncbi:hypothetical protein [Alteribacillus bidgolensis]|uniref:hypothetical protein n=1 Tax=Alteribacillus bidgolensis TaxID=930129 RepID=UPI000B8302FE|nr:hypothetical protein [Alteribacillus bidgolensis]
MAINREQLLKNQRKQRHPIEGQALHNETAVKLELEQNYLQSTHNNQKDMQIQDKVDHKPEPIRS